MPRYRVFLSTKTFAFVDVEAKNEEEAKKLAPNLELSVDDEYDDSLWKAEEVEELMCEGCGKSLFSNESIVQDDNRHTMCI